MINLAVKFYADLKDLTTGLKTATTETATFADKGGKNFREFSKEVNNAKRIYQDMAFQFGATSKQAQDAFKVWQTGKQAMTSITQAGKEKISVFQKLQGSYMGLIAGFTAVTAATAGVVSFFKSAVEGAMKDERAEKRLQFALGGSAAATERMLRFKDKMMSGTLFTEEQIMSTINMGAELGKTEAQIKKMTEAAMGISRVTGQDLNTVMLQLSGTFEGQTGRLGKLAGEIKGLTDEQLRNGEAVDVLAEKYGKFATEGINTMAGSVAQMKKQWGEIGDEIGNATIKVVTFFKDVFATATPLPSLGLLTGVFDKGGSGPSLQQQKDETAARWKDIEAMKEQAKLWQVTPKMHENIMKSVQSESKAVDEAWQSYVRYMQAQASGGLVGPEAPTIGQATAAAPVQGMTSIGFNAPQNIPTTAPGMSGGQVSILQQLSEGIDEIVGKLGNFAGVWSNTFNSAKMAVVNVMQVVADKTTGAFEKILEVASSVMSVIASIVSDSQAKQTEEINARYDNERQRIEQSYMSEDQKRAAIDKLNKKEEKERKRLLREQAKDNKIVATMQAIIAGALAVVQALSMGMPVGLIMAAIVGALAAAQIAMIIAQPLPALASGGLAYGPTMAMVGDNPNAIIDPEVISPLSKLRGLIESDGGYIASTRIAGDDLLLIVEKAQTRKGRLY